jgi:hypothetical protein
MFADLPESEKRVFANSAAMSSILEGKTAALREKLRTEREIKVYLMQKVSDLQQLLGESNEARKNKQRDFGGFTKTELRKFMTSDGVAKDIIKELVDRGIKELIERDIEDAPNSAFHNIFNACLDLVILELNKTAAKEGRKAVSENNAPPSSNEGLVQQVKLHLQHILGRPVRAANSTDDAPEEVEEQSTAVLKRKLDDTMDEVRHNFGHKTSCK